MFELNCGTLIFYGFQSYKLKLRREEALRILQNVTADDESGSSRSSSPSLELEPITVLENEMKS